MSRNLRYNNLYFVSCVYFHWLLSFRTQDLNIKKGIICNPHQIHSVSMVHSVFKIRNLLDLLQKSTIRALFKAKSVHPKAYSPSSYMLSWNFPEEFMHLSSGTPGWCGVIRGLYGDFATKFLPLWWGKCGDFWMPYSRGEWGDFASVQLRGDRERSIIRSIDVKMNRGVSF